MAAGDKATTSRWDDFENNGRIDLYISSYTSAEVLDVPDFLFRNDGTRFTGVIPQLIVKCGTGIQSGWTSTKTATWIFRSPTTIRAAGQGRLGA